MTAVTPEEQAAAVLKCRLPAVGSCLGWACNRPRAAWQREGWTAAVTLKRPVAAVSACRLAVAETSSQTGQTGRVSS
jgi:hypothetical protein